MFLSSIIAASNCQVFDNNKIKIVCCNTRTTETILIMRQFSIIIFLFSLYFCKIPNIKKVFKCNVLTLILMGSIYNHNQGTYLHIHLVVVKSNRKLYAEYITTSFSMGGIINHSIMCVCVYKHILLIPHQSSNE